MPAILLPLGIRVAVEYEVFGKIVVNIYHVTTTDPIISVKLLDIAGAFANWWENFLAAEFSEDIALTQITALDLSVANGEKQTLVISPALPGDRLTPAIPNNVAIVASLGTAKTGRSFRGRSYHAGMSDDNVTGNDFSEIRSAAVVAAYGDLDTLLDTLNAILVVASFQSAGAPRETGVATPVESVSMNARVDTQRRRLPKA